MSKISSKAGRYLKYCLNILKRRREEGVYDFTQIMHEYGKYLLPEFLSNPRNSLARGFNSMIRDYVATDPRYQSNTETYGVNAYKMHIHGLSEKVKQ